MLKIFFLTFLIKINAFTLNTKIQLIESIITKFFPRDFKIKSRGILFENVHKKLFDIFSR